MAARVRRAGAAAELGHVALDGKRLRGSRTAEGPGVHPLAAFCRSLQGVIAESRVPPGGNEITAALTLLKSLAPDGLLVTGDAEFARRALCRTIVQRGGDYFFVVKNNQPRLREDIALVFAAPPRDGGDGGGAASPRDAAPWPRRRMGQGPRPDRVAAAGGHRGPHGLPDVAGCGAGLPDRAVAPDQGRGERRGGPCAHQPHPRRADAARLLELSRAHWGIGNRPHRVRGP